VREQSKVDRDAAAKDRAAAAQDRAAARALGDDEPADVIDLDQHRHDTSSQAG
jgi:hypothetical protein